MRISRTKWLARSSREGWCEDQRVGNCNTWARRASLAAWPVPGSPRSTSRGLHSFCQLRFQLRRFARLADQCRLPDIWRRDPLPNCRRLGPFGEPECGRERPVWPVVVAPLSVIANWWQPAGTAANCVLFGVFELRWLSVAPPRPRGPRRKRSGDNGTPRGQNGIGIVLRLFKDWRPAQPS